MAFPGRREQGICDSRSERCHARLSDARGRLGRRHDVHLDLRHLVHTQHPIAVEVALFHATVFDCDGPVKRRTETETDAALHLGGDDIRIDGRSTINGAHYAVDPESSRWIDGDFRHLCDERLESLGDGNPTPPALGKRAVGPAGLLGRQLEDASQARMMLEELASIRERVLAGSVRHLVDERLDGEGRVRAADHAPPQYGYADLGRR